MKAKGWVQKSPWSLSVLGKNHSVAWAGVGGG